MSEKIFVVEDDRSLSKLVSDYLVQQGFDVECIYEGEGAAERIVAEQPDFVVLDLMLPGKDGISICRSIRPEYSGPVLMLTALDDDIDQVSGLEVGADDYVTKPVHPRVLLARIRALLRRANAAPADASKKVGQLTFGPIEIDNGRRELRVDNELVELTSGEFDLLWLIAVNSGEVLSRDFLYKELRGIEYNGIDRSMDLRICKLRSKIGDDPDNPEIIKTVRGQGYLFMHPSA